MQYSWLGLTEFLCLYLCSSASKDVLDHILLIAIFVFDEFLFDKAAKDQGLFALFVIHKIILINSSY